MARVEVVRMEKGTRGDIFYAIRSVLPGPMSLLLFGLTRIMSMLGSLSVGVIWIMKVLLEASPIAMLFRPVAFS